MDDTTINPDETLVFIGAEVKALGEGKVGGYLIRYGNPKSVDLEGDFFTAGTEYGVTEGSVLPVYYQHGMDGTLKTRRIGRGKVKFDDIGMWLEAQLEMRDEYEKMIYELAEQGALGWSSGAAGHLVEREQVGKAYHIKSWPIAEGSLTPTPAEPRNQAVTLKSLVTPDADRSGAEPIRKEKGEENAAKTAKENIEMEREELKSLFDEQTKSIEALVETKAKEAAEKAVENVLDNLPEVKAQMNGKAQVTVDEADRPFKSVAEQMLAQKSLTQGKVDPRMKRIQALSQKWMDGNDNAKALLGSNETIPSQGEFLLEPTISAEFLKPLHEEGPLTQFARRMPVGPNSISGWINGIDETSRAAGSRWGGVRGYWLAEGDAMTASQPKFKRINWELHQLAVLQYATDYMLKDAALMDSVIRESSLEELKFLVNDAFMRGSGAGQPQGILNSAALISATRTDANEIDHDDVLRVVSRIHPNAYARMVWLATPAAMAQIDKLNFTSGTTGILSPYVTYDANGVTRLRGRPVVYNEFSPSLGAVGDLLLWDPQDYLYWEGAGVEGASSIHVQFLTNQTVFRFIYRCDGMPATYSALTPYQSTDTVSTMVALAATT